MSIQSRITDGVLIVNLQGDLDHHAVEQLRDDIEKQLKETAYRALVMSFRDIDFMDSSGLGLILGRYRSISQHGGKMVLCEVNGALRRLFDMSGLLKVLPLHETEDAAIRAVKGA